MAESHLSLQNHITTRGSERLSDLPEVTQSGVVVGQ